MVTVWPTAKALFAVYVIEDPLFTTFVIVAVKRFEVGFKIKSLPDGESELNICGPMAKVLGAVNNAKPFVLMVPIGPCTPCTPCGPITPCAPYVAFTHCKELIS
jgi:hypothetical protein